MNFWVTSPLVTCEFSMGRKRNREQKPTKRRGREDQNKTKLFLLHNVTGSRLDLGDGRVSKEPIILQNTDQDQLRAYSGKAVHPGTRE